MNDIINSITKILAAIWSMMDFNLLPGMSIKSLFLFFWITSTCAMFFRIFVFGNISDEFDDD